MGRERLVRGGAPAARPLPARVGGAPGARGAPRARALLPRHRHRQPEGAPGAGKLGVPAPSARPRLLREPQLPHRRGAPPLLGDGRGARLRAPYPRAPRLRAPRRRRPDPEAAPRRARGLPRRAPRARGLRARARRRLRQLALAAPAAHVGPRHRVDLRGDDPRAARSARDWRGRRPRRLREGRVRRLLLLDHLPPAEHQARLRQYPLGHRALHDRAGHRGRRLARAPFAPPVGSGARDPRRRRRRRRSSMAGASRTSASPGRCSRCISSCPGEA